MKSLEMIKKLKHSDYFWSYMDQLWEHYDNLTLMDLDLKDLSERHEWLIEQNLMLLEKEKNQDTAKLLKDLLNFNEVFHQAEHASSAYGIQLLHDYEKIYIVGDLHSDAMTLKAFLDKIDFFKRANTKEQFKIVFLGDYVDRGKNHLKTLEILMLIKMVFPTHICLLRGNHDGGSFDENQTLKLPYRIPEQDDPLWYFPKYLLALKEKNESLSDTLIHKYFEFFNALNYIAVIQTDLGNYACIHGGLPKPIESDKPYDHLKSISDLTQYEALDNVGATICENIMWSDPYRGEGDLKRHMRRFFYTESDFDFFGRRFGIDKLFRGHEVVDNGLRVHFEGKVFTVFSSGKAETSYYHWVNPAYVELSPSGAYMLRRIWS